MEEASDEPSDSGEVDDLAPISHIPTPHPARNEHGLAALARAKSTDDMDTLLFECDTQAGIQCDEELPATQPLFLDDVAPVLHRTSGALKERSNDEALADLAAERWNFDRQLASAASSCSNRLQEFDAAAGAEPIEIDSETNTPVKDGAASSGSMAMASGASFDLNQAKIDAYAKIMKEVQDKLAAVLSEPKAEPEVEASTEQSKDAEGGRGLVSQKRDVCIPL